MLNEIIKKLDWCGSTLLLSTGKIAHHADGSILISMGNTSVLCTVVFNKTEKENIDFFPLSVYYREMSYAAGRIPGGFIKKEGKSSDSEILISRLIDRSIRPLFDSNFRNETQIICTVMSYDYKHSPDILSIIGSIAALAISGIPIVKLAAAARVSLIEKKLVLNPAFTAAEHGELDLVVTATSDAVTMIEAKACEIAEQQLLEAVEFAHNSTHLVVKAIEELRDTVGKPMFKVTPRARLNYKPQILQQFGSKIKSILLLEDKIQRDQQLAVIESQVIEYCSDNTNDQEPKVEVANLSDIKHSLHEAKSHIFKEMVLSDKQRIGGNRSADGIRSIICETNLFERVHGSALFARGGTQSLATLTLGGTSDEQIVEQLGHDKRQHFLLDYIFLPYAVGETTPLRASSRREIGHGWLANKALQVVIPEKNDFPYTIRLVSEITQSDGSSSMATVCSASLCLMSAGVPIKAHVAGIAMGVVIGDDNNFAVLSDISAAEDHLGDMDFKVASTEKGITALQLDVKVHGINIDILSQACEQARVGRHHILKIMNNVIDKPRSELSAYAPLMQTIEISKDKIRDVIGAGGKVIKEICKSHSVEIDVSEEGIVKVWGGDSHNVKNAIQSISNIAINPQIGNIFNGEVVRIIESGAFIRYTPDKDGFLHISEIQDSNVVDINDHLNIGDKIKVKIIGFDRKNRVKLSLKLNKASPNHSRVDNGDSRNSSTRKRIRPKPNDQATVSERKYFD